MRGGTDPHPGHRQREIRRRFWAVGGTDLRQVAESTVASARAAAGEVQRNGGTPGQSQRLGDHLLPTKRGRRDGEQAAACPRRVKAAGGRTDGRMDMPRWLERNSGRPSRPSAGSGVKSPSFPVTSLNDLVACGEAKGCHQLHSSSTAASGSARPTAPLCLRRTQRRNRVVGPPAPPVA